nr:HD domain-containing protein [Jatrophihabitans sp. SB3-54]
MSNDESWAQATARRLLSEVGGRYPHSACVATRAAEAACVLLSSSDAELVTAAAWLHDVGYSPDLVQTGFHPLDGARWLRTKGVAESVCRLVAWHTSAFAEATERGMTNLLLAEFPRPDEKSLRVLTWADLTSSATGQPCTVEERVAEILARYPSHSPVYRTITAARAELTRIGSEVGQAIRSTK